MVIGYLLTMMLLVFPFFAMTFYMWNHSQKITGHVKMTIIMSFMMLFCIVVGAIMGVMSGHILSATMLSMFTGVLAAVLIGFRFNLTCIFNGIVSGIMGGMMGAMLGVMVPAELNTVTIRVMVLWYILLSLLAIVGLFHEHIKFKWSVTFILVAVLYLYNHFPLTHVP